MNKLTLILLAGAMTLGLNAQSQEICTSNGLNNWGVAFTCVGSGSPNTYIIQAGDSVWLGGNQSGVDTLIIYGKLQFNNNRRLTINSGGVVQIMPGGQIAGGNLTSSFDFATGVDPTGPFSISGPMYSGGGAFQSGYLPVEFLDIQARYEQDLLVVNWSTASEQDNSHFELETSTNGGEWMTQATVPSLAASGNSIEILNYEYAIAGAVNTEFVRIKQVDFDNTMSYSKVIRVEKGLEPDFSITRNSGLELTIEHSSVGAFEAKLFDMLGAEVASGLSSSDQLNLNVSAPGIYVLEVIVDGRSSFRKVSLNP